MSIVLRRNNGDILWFDAITQYDVTYSASVTKHPVATGGFVSDHTTTDNVVLNISGVLSDADFNLSRPANLGSLPTFKFDTGEHVPVDENGLYKPTQKQYTNNSSTAYPVTITDKTSINKLLPEVIAQFTKDNIPDAFVTQQDKVKTAKAVQRELIHMWKTREEFQVLDLLDDFVMDSFGPCVFTNITFKEDETTGEGIFPTMTIEQVTFTDLQEISVKVKTSNKGRKTGAITKKEGTKAEAPPANNPTQQSKEDVSAANSAKG
ncbi:tail fiber protein [Pseudomonas phage UNO-G1W1]|uniref:Tail fiber protein n=1 Tax=Pseudomonas phage UNO-G1W1 TaxID=3136609 RepID=A0AAX4MX55_9CAUD